MCRPKSLFVVEVDGVVYKKHAACYYSVIQYDVESHGPDLGTIAKRVTSALEPRVKGQNANMELFLVLLKTPQPMARYYETAELDDGKPASHDSTCMHISFTGT